MQQQKKSATARLIKFGLNKNDLFSGNKYLKMNVPTVFRNLLYLTKIPIVKPFPIIPINAKTEQQKTPAVHQNPSIFIQDL